MRERKDGGHGVCRNGERERERGRGGERGREGGLWVRDYEK